MRPNPAPQLEALVRFHVDFAMASADVIRVQDRDLASLTDSDRHTVRRLQREYVELWVGVLGRRYPDRAELELRVSAHSMFDSSTRLRTASATSGRPRRMRR